MNDPVVSQTAPFLLTTKLHRPRSATVELPRLRLLQQLSAGLHHPLTLIAAPAGYGKTTLINQWLDVVDLPYAWLSLDESDGDPATFLTYVLAAIRTVYPHTDSATELLLKAPDLPSPPRLADSLLRDLARLPGALLLVLEDYHFIQTLAVHAIMTELVQHLPPHVHLALTTRVDPPWPLERLRGRQQLVEIRSADLRFTLDEATQLLSQLLGPAAADETATLLEEANEGWAIGLQLAALALRGRDDPAAIARSIAGGSHQLIIDYLLAEVLQGLPDDQRAFLLETSLLDRFCAPLYDALWDERRPFMIDDGAKRVTGNDMLRAVRRSNLFLVPLDPEGVWFRYHHLFTNLLRIRLQQAYTQEQIRDLHARAAAWFAAHALEDEAIAHFLRAGDAPSAAALIEERVHSLLDQENWRQLERWLAQLPAEARQLPALLTAQAALHFLHYRFALIGPLLDAAEAAIAQQPAREPTTLTPLQGEIARLRACIAFNDADDDAMLHWAGIARAKLRPEMQYAMGLADFFFICGLHASGRYAEAVAFAHQQLDAAGQYPALALRILLALCSIYYDRADVPALQRSGATLQQVARRADLTTSLAWSHEIQGWLHYQRNELAAAEASLRSLVAIAPLAHGRALLDGFTGLTLIHLAQDEPEQAYDTVTTLRTHLLERSMLVLLPVADALQQRVQLHSGPPTSLHRHYQAPQHFPIVFWEQPALMQARMLLACGAAHDLAEATVLLADARARAAERHSPRVQIEACALAALVYAAQGDEAAALGALQEAVEMAAPGGALRLLADCGPGLAGLLHKLLDAGVAPTYVRQVLAVLGASPQEPPVPPPAPSAAQPQALAETTLAETLTNREVDVLILLAQRLSDKEIAERLFLAPGTIKKHANNIYRKLDVHNRREAAAYARRLGLH